MKKAQTQLRKLKSMHAFAPSPMIVLLDVKAKVNEKLKKKKNKMIQREKKLEMGLPPIAAEGEGEVSGERDSEGEESGSEALSRLPSQGCVNR